MFKTFQGEMAGIDESALNLPGYYSEPKTSLSGNLAAGARQQVGFRSRIYRNLLSALRFLKSAWENITVQKAIKVAEEYRGYFG